MKRTHLFGTMMACTLAAAVSVGAQDRPTTSQSDREGKSVVVTGCLKSGSSMATGTTGTGSTAGTAGTSGSTASSASRGSFIITDAVVASGSASTSDPTGTASPTGSTAGTAGTGSTAGTSGTSPSATNPGTAMGKTFTLVGGQQSQLQGFVNSQVEIRGTLDQNADRSAAGSATGSTAGTPTTSTTPTTGTPTTGSTASGTGSTMAGMSHGNQPQLRVTSVRQIAGSCSQ